MSDPDSPRKRGKPTAGQSSANQPPALPGPLPPAGQIPRSTVPVTKKPHAGRPACAPVVAGPHAAGPAPTNHPPVGELTAAVPQKMHPAPPVQEYLYDAFISYRHVDPDRQWAKWLHTTLETYRVPQQLRKQRRLPARLKKVFRDEEELPASADLNKEIEKALTLSRFLIVICSPHTPESEWVNKEVVRFRQMKRDDRILALLIDGEPGRSFPRALREIRRKLIDAQGNARLAVEQVEPLAADVRPSRSDESPRHLKRMAKLRMLACILGVSFDDLRRRDHERFVRRMIATAAGSSVLAVVLFALSFLAVSESKRANLAAIDVKQKTEQVRLEQERVKQEQERVRQQTELTRQQAALAAEKAKLAEEKEHLAKEKEEEAEFHNLLKRREIYIGNMKTAWNAWQRNALREMAVELNKYDPLRAPENAKLRGFEWYYLNMLPREGCRTLDFDGFVHAAQFSPDGSRIAAVGEHHATNQHCVRIWTLPAGQLERTLKLADMTGLRAMDQPSAINAPPSLAGSRGIAYSPNGRLVAATCLLARNGAREGVIKVWESESGREVFSAAEAAIGGHSVNFGSDGKHLYAGTGRHLSPEDSGAADAIVWSVEDWTLVSRLPSTSPSGIQGSRTRLANRVNKRAAHLDDILAHGPDGLHGHWAISRGDKPGTARLLDVSKRSKIKREPIDIAVEPGPIHCVAITDQHVAIARSDGVVELGSIQRNTGSIADRQLYRGHFGCVTCLTFSSDQQQLAAAGESSVVVWSTQATPEHALLEHYGLPHWETRFISGHPSTITVYDVRTREPVARFNTTVRDDSALAASPDRRYCAIADKHYQTKNKGDINLFDAHSGDETRILHGHNAEVASLMFDPAGARLLSASQDGTVRLWDVADAREIKVLRVPGAEPGPWGGCRKAVFAGNARWIVASSAKTITYWPTDGNEIYRSIDYLGGDAWTCSADGSLLAFYVRESTSGRINIWDIEKDQIISQLSLASRPIHLAFTLDGRRLVGGGAIWSVESGEDIFPLPGDGADEFVARIERLERDWRAKLDPPTK